MPLPEQTEEGYLPPGIYAASLMEVLARFGTGSAARQRQGDLLQLVIEAALAYPTIKRVLVWGSFVTTKRDPGDLDYSLVVSVDHRHARVASEHARFLVPYEARRRYGVDTGYVVLADYPVELFAAALDLLCHRRDRQSCGIVEISLRGETRGER